MKHPDLSLCLVLLCLLPAAEVGCQGFPPDGAVRRMTVADGFEVKLVASEPLVRQPVTITFDDRGRLWVIQYLQYPNPAGLQPVQVDQYLRTKYDRVPEPPPHGPKGQDRITILEDADGDGVFDKSKDFVTGLNLASGMCLGHGGVFVAQPPYLLFYPDRDRDDVPDGDPEVLLTGFGMEDAHAFANSLQWGPDGWLYGAHGSTSYANIRGIEFVQGVWRYHPITREFELFSEGGGNTWGLDFDRQGNVIAGTNFGGKAMLHQFQGAYYVKNFSKHGELKNPHAYGYFEHVPYTGFQGGHVTCGGIVYQGGAFPEKFHDQYIAANLLSNSVFWHRMDKAGSSYTAIFGGELIVANDTWCRPVDCLTGPDGAVYIADWYDQRATHLDPRDNWDRRNGRVYKLQPKGLPPVRGLDLSKLRSAELVGLLGHKNNWFRREARRLLAERRDKTVLPALQKLIDGDEGQLALEALWALYVSGGCTDDLAAEYLHHPAEEVRTWAVRLLGDAKTVTPQQRQGLVELAGRDPSPLVRSQLACTARRLPGADAVPVLREMIRRNEDLKDPYIPLLIWWAVEEHAVSDREAVLGLLAEPEAWRLPVVRQVLLERLARRYLADFDEAGYRACARLLDAAPGPAEAQIVVRGMEKALKGRPLREVPAPLRAAADRLAADPAALPLLVRLGSRAALERAVAVAADPKAPDRDRVAIVKLLGETGSRAGLAAVLAAFRDGRSTALRQAALAALPSYRDEEVTRAILEAYPTLPAGLRGPAAAVVCSRPESALQVLQLIDGGRVPRAALPLDLAREVYRFDNAEIKSLVEKHYGKIGPATPGEKLARIDHYRRIVRQGGGDPARGHPLFTKNCGVCHKLFGEGSDIGPELTGADRGDLDFLLGNIVDPSAVQRPEYSSYVLLTSDGRSLLGRILRSSPEAVTLVNAQQQTVDVPRSRIEEFAPSPVSLMPERLLDPLGDQELRDLFAYLQAKTPPQVRKEAAGEKKGGKLLRVLLISGSLEYKSDESLAKYQDYLESSYNVKCLRAFRQEGDKLPGVENLMVCDVAVFFTRRLTPPKEQLDLIREYCKAGKPVVGIRTASHGLQNWLEFDKLVLGGDYQNHYKEGPVCRVKIVDKNKDHPVLRGVGPFTSVGSLYKNPDIADDTTLLLTGSIPDHTEPVAWTRLHNGGRVFYTSLGHPRDFEDENFVRLITNALYWAAAREVPE